MVRPLVIVICLGLTARITFAQNQAVETCKTRATEAQTACQNAQNSSNNMAQVFIKLGIMVAALTSKGTQGGMCQMMSALSSANANQLQSNLQPCQNAAAACKTACATAANDTNTKSSADTTNLSAAQNNCQVAEKQGAVMNNDMLKLLEIAATAAVCLKELGMKEETTTTTTTTTPTLNCTDPANAANPICICQANPMAGGCGNTIGEVKKIEGGESSTPSGTDAAPTPSQTRNDDLQGSQRSPSAKKADLPRGTAGAMPGAEGGAMPTGTARAGVPAPSGTDAAVLAGSQAGGGGGNRGGAGGGYPEFVNTSSGLRPLSRGPASSVAFAPGGLMGKHRDLFKTVHKRYKALFGEETGARNSVSP